MHDSILGSGYALLDSGDLMKLEKLGEKIIARPSSLSFWSKRLPKERWHEAHATFTPGKGWVTRGGKFESWEVQFPEFKLRLRLQDNGQVGIFPEHSSYLEQLINIISSRDTKNQDPPKVLNLFAFTGMASVVLGKIGCEICHVDLSKKALTWAKENFELNSLSEKSYRLIPEDSVTFLQRESRRKNSYDLILIDPPSFSRTGNSAWKLEEEIVSMMSICASLLNPKGVLVFSCHHAAINATVLKNLVFEVQQSSLTIIEAEDQSIPEKNSERAIPAGSYLLCRKQ